MAATKENVQDGDGGELSRSFAEEVEQGLASVAVLGDPEPAEIIAQRKRREAEAAKDSKPVVLPAADIEERTAHI